LALQSMVVFADPTTITETVAGYRSPSFAVLLSKNDGTADFSSNTYYRIGGGGSLTLMGNSNVENIISVKLNYQEASRIGSNVTVSSGVINGDVISEINATSLTITSEGIWPQLWLASLEVTYSGSDPLGQYYVFIDNLTSHGTLTSDKVWADVGDVVMLQAFADEDYYLERITANWGVVKVTRDVVETDVFTFTMPAEDVVVQVWFSLGESEKDPTVVGMRPTEIKEKEGCIDMEIYNLYGQQLATLRKGLNIVGGKKIVKK